MRVVTTSRAVRLGLVYPSVISVADSFCVVSGKGVLLDIGVFITDSSDMLILVVVEAVDVSIGLIGAFCFAVCRVFLVMFGALFGECFDVSWLSLSLSACFVSWCSFSFVNFECSLPLNFDMLDVISASSVFSIGFRSRFSSRVDPIAGSSLLVGKLSSVAVGVLISLLGVTCCFAIFVVYVPTTASTSFPVLFSESISMVLFRFVSVCSVVLLFPDCFSKLRWLC